MDVRGRKCRCRACTAAHFLGNTDLQRLLCEHVCFGIFGLQQVSKLLKCLLNGDAAIAMFLCTLRAIPPAELPRQLEETDPFCQRSIRNTACSLYSFMYGNLEHKTAPYPKVCPRSICFRKKRLRTSCRSCSCGAVNSLLMSDARASSRDGSDDGAEAVRSAFSLLG